MQQLTIFAEAPLCRRSDPPTSKAAAIEARALQARHQLVIIAALRAHGPAGKDRIATLCSLTGVQVCRRLVELERAGRVRPTGRLVSSTAGRQEREWEVA